MPRMIGLSLLALVAAYGQTQTSTVRGIVKDRSYRPRPRPYSALKPLVSTANSVMASTEGVLTFVHCS
jgi:hypothetical protein